MVSAQALEVIRKLKEVMPIKRTKMLLRIHFAARGKRCMVSAVFCSRWCHAAHSGFSITFSDCSVWCIHPVPEWKFCSRCSCIHDSCLQTS
jgi:ribosome maturation protein Sdo1